MRAVIVCAAICVTSFPISFGAAPAMAAAPPADTAAAAAQAASGLPHAHGGFYLRWTTGLGTAGVKTEFDNGPGVPKSPFKLSGFSGEGDVAIGTAPFKSLPIAFHVTVWGWRVNDPEMDDPDNVDTAPGTTGVKLNGVLSAGAVGPGVTWFLPRNSYVSVAGGVAKISLKRADDKAKYKTKSGTAVDILAGKEWWVAPSWGIGLAGGLNYFSAKDPKATATSGPQGGLYDDGSKWSGVSYSLRLSATYN